MKELLQNKKKSTILAALAVAILAIIIILITNLNKGIDLSTYINVKVDGLNTQGSASYVLDQDTLESMLIKNNVDRFGADAFVKTIKCDFDRENNLKNGDVIHTTIRYDKTLADQLGIKLREKNKSIKVSGLAEGKKTDVFKNIKVSFSGVSPDGKVSVINQSNDP